MSAKKFYQYIIFDMLKFILGTEAWGNKTKEVILRLRNESYISFVSFLQASEPSMNFNIPKMLYSKRFQTGRIQPKNIVKRFTSDCIYRNADLNFY